MNICEKFNQVFVDHHEYVDQLKIKSRRVKSCRQKKPRRERRLYRKFKPVKIRYKLSESPWKGLEPESGWPDQLGQHLNVWDIAK